MTRERLLTAILLVALLALPFVAALIVGLVDMVGRPFGPILLGMVMEPSAASQTGRTLAPMLIYILMAGILFFRPSGLFPAKA